MPWSWPRTGRPGRRSATAPAAGRRRCRPRSCPRSRRRDRGGRGRSRERGTRPLRPPPRARRPRSAGRYRRPPGGGAALTGQRRSPARGYPPTTSPSLTGVIACRSTPSAASPVPLHLVVLAKLLRPDGAPLGEERLDPRPCTNPECVRFVSIVRQRTLRESAQRSPARSSSWGRSMPDSAPGAPRTTTPTSGPAASSASPCSRS